MGNIEGLLKIKNIIKQNTMKYNLKMFIQDLLTIAVIYIVMVSLLILFW